MNTLNEDEFSEFYKKMQDSEDYLKIQDLKDKHVYTICARNANVGIWIELEKAFMISRYEVSATPYLFNEYHWDTGEPYGTVKPLKLIGKCSLEIKDSYSENETKEILNYLDKLEENNPIISGYNSLQSRRKSAIKFEQMLAGTHRNPTKSIKHLR